MSMTSSSPDPHYHSCRMKHKHRSKHHESETLELLKSFHNQVTETHQSLHEEMQNISDRVQVTESRDIPIVDTGTNKDRKQSLSNPGKEQSLPNSDHTVTAEQSPQDNPNGSLPSWGDHDKVKHPNPGTRPWFQHPRWWGHKALQYYSEADGGRLLKVYAQQETLGKQPTPDTPLTLLAPKETAESAQQAIKLLGNASTNMTLERQWKATNHLNPHQLRTKIHFLM